MFGGGFGVVPIGLAAGDGGAAKCLDGIVDGFAGLLAENTAEERAERADVAAEGSFFELAGGGLEFGKALRPVGGRPQRRHKSIMHCGDAATFASPAESYMTCASFSSSA